VANVARLAAIACWSESLADLLQGGWIFTTTEPIVEGLITNPSFLEQAKRPIIISGGGTIYSGACDELRKFCDEFCIPLTETQAGTERRVG
jgi:TPP-dependent trihydroxycyclohexane-1,2-dione (THcHDO) dehydratase